MEKDRYAITGPLGTGTGGTVYTAWDRFSRREVALRLLAREDLAAQFTDKSFVEHCRAALGVRHRCVVPISAVFELGEMTWPTVASPSSVVVATPRIYGMTLDDVLAVRPVLAPPELAFMLAELAGALSALHRAGLAHGDVSPRNVIVEPAGTLKLVDWFGGGRAERGTPGFRAPEVEAGTHGVEPVSGPADAASLARLVVHCAGGTGEFAEVIGRILAPWLGETIGTDRPGLAELGARASEISAGREPLTTGQAPELAGEAMRRAALAAPTEPGTKPAASGLVAGKVGRIGRATRLGLATVLSAVLLFTVFYSLRNGQTPLPETGSGGAIVAAPTSNAKADAEPGASANTGQVRQPTPSAAGESENRAQDGNVQDASTATPGPDCALFTALSAQRDAAIEGADVGGLQAIYLPQSAGLSADLSVAEGMQRSGIEVEGIKTELSRCVDLGGGLIEVESRQGPYRWRRNGGEWTQEPAGESLTLRVQLRDGKVDSISQASR